METKQSLVHEERIINAKNTAAGCQHRHVHLGSGSFRYGPHFGRALRIPHRSWSCAFHCVHHSVLRTENLKSERSPCICPFW